jgi:disulfide bond formation protein DsbB
MFIKKMYIMSAVIALGFLYFNCGGNEKEDANQNQELKSNTNMEETMKGNAAEGQKYFAQTCSACHGMDAKGLPKLGKDLTTSKFVVEKTDLELLAFLKQGRLATDPLNTTGVAMPPKGGNPAFNDQQLMDIISYLRKIHL